MSHSSHYRTRFQRIPTLSIIWRTALLKSVEESYRRIFTVSWCGQVRFRGTVAHCLWSQILTKSWSLTEKCYRTRSDASVASLMLRTFCIHHSRLCKGCENSLEKDKNDLDENDLRLSPFGR
jgi:hypothetical protein